MEIPVKLAVFEGSLDLLLHLIERNKVAITDIPIVLITDQYLEMIKTIGDDELEVMSDFIEMAATLIAIKIKMIFPAPVVEGQQEEDPRQELVERLLEYKKYKLISDKLRQKGQEAGYRVFRQEMIPEEVRQDVPRANPEELLADLGFDQLYRVFKSVMLNKQDKIDPIRSRFGKIKKEKKSVHQKLDEIRCFRGQGRLSFRRLLENNQSKTEVIVTFLAVLEMIKLTEIKIYQENLFADIELEFIGENAN